MLFYQIFQIFNVFSIIINFFWISNHSFNWTDFNPIPTVPTPRPLPFFLPSYNASLNIKKAEREREKNVEWENIISSQADSNNFLLPLYNFNWNTFTHTRLNLNNAKLFSFYSFVAHFFVYFFVEQLMTAVDGRRKGVEG